MRKKRMGYIFPRRVKDTMLGMTTTTTVSTYVADEETKKLAEIEANKKIARENALKEARQPWFCPSCNKIMSHRLDSKYWYRYGKCMNCVLAEEDASKLSGEYKEKIETMSMANMRAFLNDSKIAIEEYLSTLTGEWKVAREDGSVEIVKSDPEKERKVFEEELDYINKQLMILDAKTPEEEAELIERFNKELESKTEE